MSHYVRRDDVALIPCQVLHEGHAFNQLFQEVGLLSGLRSLSSMVTVHAPKGPSLLRALNEKGNDRIEV